MTSSVSVSLAMMCSTFQRGAADRATPPSVAACPLRPESDRTVVLRRMSALCQLLTHAVQQTAPLFDHRVGTGEFPWRCKAVSGGLRRQRQRSSFGTSRGNGSPEAQRWHAGAEGSLAQISGVSLSCIRYRVTAKSTRRIAMTIQILMRDIMGMKPRCEWNSPTGVREFCWRRVSSLGQAREYRFTPPGAC
jgi:hypothetical protein